MHDQGSKNSASRSAQELEQRVLERTAELHRANQALKREIQDRERAEAHLRESERRLQAIVDNAPAVVFLKDLEGRYLLVNRIYEKIFHVTRQQMIGQTDYDVFPMETAEQFRRNDRRVCETGRALEMEEEAPHDDGIHTYISLKFPMYDGQGNVQGLCGVSTDITERKLAEESLQTAKKAAEDASLAKSRFLANMSHEIRTPITAMLGAAELLASDPSASKQSIERSEMILRNGRHLLALVENLLDLSLIEAGRLRVRCEETSLIDIFSDSLALTWGVRQQKPEVDFRLEFESAVPESVLTDRTRVTQAIVNLVHNAMKFTARGQVVVRVGIHGESSESRVHIVVDDSGPGISQEDLDRIFEAFVQIRSISQGASSGVGLGLSLARWIAESLGGSLVVESTLGRGSRFTLIVPCPVPPGTPMMSAAHANQRVWSTRHSEPQGPTMRLHGRILIAEDAPDTREVLTYALEAAGATVVGAENGAEAVRCAETQNFDLILMDIRMPVMDGISALAELRKRGNLSVVVALTASASPSDQNKIAQAGFDDVWQKPLPLAELVERAAHFLPNAEHPLNHTAGLNPNSDRRRNNDFMLKAIQGFASSLPDRMLKLRAAVEARDFSGSAEVLHQLVGSAGMHGFSELSDESARLLGEIRKKQQIDTPSLRIILDLASQAMRFEPSVGPTQTGDDSSRQ